MPGVIVAPVRSVTGPNAGLGRRRQDSGTHRGPHGVPAEERRRPFAARHRAARGQLHGVHAVRPLVPRLVHLHRGSQAARPAARRAGNAATGGHLDRFDIDYASVHVLRHLRRGLPVRRPVLEPEYEYSEPRSPTCSTTRTSSASGWKPSELRVRSGARRSECFPDSTSPRTSASIIAAGMRARRHVEQRRARRAVAGGRAGRRRRPVHPRCRRVRRRHPRCSCTSAP